MSDSDSDHEKKAPENVPSSSGSSYEEQDEERDDKVITKKEKKDVRFDETGTLVELQSPVPRMASALQPQAQPQPRRKRFIPKYDKVEGTHRVVLTEETQLQIEMVIGSQINAQFPWKFVDKMKIMDCIQSAGKDSEFFLFKEELEEYDDDLVLMGYIADESKDQDEFYICCNKEARDHCKQQSDKFIKRQEKKIEKSLQRKPRPWVSLGSEKEITELEPLYYRSLMEVEIKTTYPTLYDPEKFHVRDVLSVKDGYIELTPYRQKFSNIYRRRVDCAAQIGNLLVNREAQTVLRYPQNKWTQSIADALGQYDPNAGGDVDDFLEKDDDDDSSSGEEITVKHPIDEIGLAAYKRAYKRLRRPSYTQMVEEFVTAKITEMDSLVELNTVMDIYCNDYPNLVAQKTVDIYDSMTFEEYVCFTDIRAKDKYVSCAVFHPMWSGIVAVCYSDGSPNVMRIVSTRPDPIQRAVYGLNPVMIWSHLDSLRPKLYLECPREVKVLSFCPFDENLLVGGCINGQVVIWDLKNKIDKVERIVVLSETREKYRIAMNAHMSWMKSVQDDAVVQATAMSSLITSHYAPITAISWLSPNFVVTSTGKQFPVEDNESSLMIFTGSEDGTILIWNLSTKNVTTIDSKKLKKSKRVLRRPSGLLVDLSPYRVLDRNLQPCYKIILAVAGRPQTLPVQSLAMELPPVKYVYTPRIPGNGRKYFRCERIKQDESEMSFIIYCGSQHGEFRRVTWEGHAFNTGEMVNTEYADIIYKCKIHDGILSCTQRNPFVNHVTLTVGGKIFAIWSDKFKGRPLVWKKRPFRLTDGKWSLYKPSLLFISNSEGDLETWDLLLRSDQPICTQTISGSLLTGVSVHTLPLQKNLIGVSDSNGSFRMFIDPPIFQIENLSYLGRMEAMINRELKVMQSFHNWQNEWMKNNPHILLEMKRKEGALLAEKEEERRRKKEEEEERTEREAELRRLARMRVVGPAERWQQIIQKLIERTIAVKKRINRAELIEHEKPLRELETQRLEKERRMLEIMKNQKTIFNDTVAILFPEAIQKPPKPKKTYLEDNREKIKKEYLEDYVYIKGQAFKTVKDNPYKATFSWDATLVEGKERREALNAHENYIKMHRTRLQYRDRSKPYIAAIKREHVREDVVEEEREDRDTGDQHE